MKNMPWQKIFSPLNICRLGYILVFIFLIKIGSLISFRVESYFFKSSLLEFYHNEKSKVSVEFFKKMGNDEKLFQVYSGKDFLTYVLPFRFSIQGKIIEGWDIFNQKLKYQGFHIMYWEGHKDWVSFLNQGFIQEEVMKKKMSILNKEVILSPFTFLPIGMRNIPGFSKNTSAFLESRVYTAFQVDEEVPVNMKLGDG